MICGKKKKKLKEFTKCFYNCGNYKLKKQNHSLKNTKQKIRRKKEKYNAN